MNASGNVAESNVELRARTIRRVKLAIVPFAGLMYFFNGMDRANISFAALRMHEAFPISTIDFANIMSAFFITYLIFQVPANMVMQRLGARRWIGTIVIGWGFATMLMFVATSVTQVLWARMLLGVFEAGFFPGMIFYFALWFPKVELAQVTAWFFVAAAAAAVVAGPVSGYIVEHFNFLGYAGWRWLFIIEGAPTVLAGLASFFVLSNTPKDAAWLKEDERTWLVDHLEQERTQLGVVQRVSVGKALSNPTLWLLAIVYMCVQGATQTAQLWAPRVLKDMNFGLTDTAIGLIMALPYLGAMICITFWGRRSDRTGERKWHAASAMALVGVSLLAFGFLPFLWMKIIAITLYGIAAFSYYGPYWAMPAAMISPAGLAVSVAFINSCSSLGGFLGGKILGYAEKGYGMTGLFMSFLLMAMISVLVLACMNVPRERPAAGRT